MSDVWDTDGLIESADFYKFLQVGDSAAGVIQRLGTKEWPAEKPGDKAKIDAELVLLDDATGEEKTLTVGTVRLKEAFIEKRPGVGDHVSVTLKRIEPRGGGKSMKHYDVQVTKGGAAPQAAAPAPVAAQPEPAAVGATQATVDPAAAAAAIAALDPATRAQLGLG